VLVGAFIARELRAPEPMLPMRMERTGEDPIAGMVEGLHACECAAGDQPH
jgi:hypothetical protein